MDNDDVLAAVLQRLAPRSLAVSRCVCRAWRATIDARRMLRGDLLPISLGGIFVSLSHEPAPPEFFARPSAGPRIAARLQDYAEVSEWPHFIDQCCNRVASSTRRHGGALDSGFGWRQAYLVFDPTVSPHYQVLLIHTDLVDQALEGLESEWPPSPYSIPVYSSRTGAWEARLVQCGWAGRQQPRQGRPAVGLVRAG
ncbi:uncharacterized protein C2845_PM02G38000 [Panicum miliaceum]|uniref:F-box domain-containing protein n=1 Tax=Panicum miliaceum TaxID=4540 RepID=A0A3L6SGB9_PANMI|nr:uncharacterized protein C2845_PM02G38000 [Panicum miliaceum]